MPGLAPQVMAWQRRMANLPGPAGASGEASTGDPVTVEMLVAGTWVDITSYCMVRDDSGQIGITRGIRDEGSQTEQSTGRLQVNDRDGRFSPRNPSGVWYTLIGRNQPLRISVPDGMGGKSYRLWGEISEYAQGWDSTGTDVWTDLSVNGILRRLAQGPAPERSVIYTAITDPTSPNLVAYWPCEDLADSATVASALVNGSPMVISGTPTLAAYDGFGASDPLPSLTGGTLTGGVIRYDTTTVTQYQVRYLLAVPSTGLTNLDVLSRVQVTPSVVGEAKYFDIHYNDPPGGVGSYGGTGTLSVLPYNSDESLLGYSGTESITLDVRNRQLRVSLEVSNNGSALSVTLRVLDINSGVTDSATIGLGGTNATRVQSITLAPSTLAQSAGVTGMAAGHVMLQTSITSITDLGRAIQPAGEAAGRRIQRLCGEDGIAVDWIGDLDDTAALGAQGRLNPLSLMQEAALADGGMLYENLAVLGLGYRTRASLYNQDPALVLDYAGYNLSQVPLPVEDDQRLANKVTVTVNGVSATYEETAGALSTALPPAGVGVYSGGGDVTLNLSTTNTDTLLDQAAWRVHLGTVDEARYPQISVNLAHSSFVADPALKRAVLALRQGDRVQVQNPPAWLPPDNIDQLILGFDETITHFEHRITFTCAPASPYTIGILDSDVARIDTDGSQLYEAAGSTDTTIAVGPSPGQTGLWTTDTADFPIPIRVGGEVMTVENILGGIADTYTRTVTSGWGSADTGETWTTSGGSASDYSVVGV